LTSRPLIAFAPEEDERIQRVAISKRLLEGLKAF